jgi:hypothetical protein
MKVSGGNLTRTAAMAAESERRRQVYYNDTKNAQFFLGPHVKVLERCPPQDDDDDVFGVFAAGHDVSCGVALDVRAAS